MPTDKTSTHQLRECATEGCEGKEARYFESGGTGSYYCPECYRKVAALAEAPGRSQAVFKAVSDALGGPGSLNADVYSAIYTGILGALCAAVGAATLEAENARLRKELVAARANEDDGLAWDALEICRARLKALTTGGAS